MPEDITLEERLAALRSMRRLGVYHGDWGLGDFMGASGPVIVPFPKQLADVLDAIDADLKEGEALGR
jgi:hypothetical protein